MHMVKPIQKTLSDDRGNSITYYAKVISTNVTDEVLDEWSLEHGAYAFGDEVKIETLKRKYVSKVENNNDYPVGSANWSDAGALNSYRGVDDKLNSFTTSDGDIVKQLDTSGCSVVALLSLQNITSIEISTTDHISGDTASDTVQLRDFGVKNLYEYFFKPVTDRKQAIVYIPESPSSTTTVTIKYSGKTIGYGALLHGREHNAGFTIVDSILNRKNKRTINEDEWGYLSFINRGVANVLDANIMIDSKYIDELIDYTDDISGMLALFIGDERDKGIQHATIWGYMENISIPMAKENTIYKAKFIGGYQNGN